MTRWFRQMALFFWRDIAISRTYRLPFLLTSIEALFGAAMLYYVAVFVESPQLRNSLPNGESYFTFSLVGFVFIDYLGVALDSFDRSLEEARDAGTLEHLLITQTSLPTVLVGSAIYPFVLTTIRIVLYIAWSALLFGFPLHAANWLGVIAVLIATILSFSGLGILSAGYLLLFKRGNPGKWLILAVSGLAGGMLFPVSVLPDWLQFVARINPVTYALDAMRAALLADASSTALLKPIAILLLFAALLLPVSILFFAWTLRRTKTTGTLAHR